MEKTFQIINTASVQAGSEMLSLRRFVKMSSGKLAYCGANQKAIGVIGTEAAQGEMAPVITHGIAILEVGSGGVTENGYVTSDANGKAVAVADVAVTIPEGATPVTSTGAQPTLVVAGGTLPVKINGLALETVSEGGTVRVILQ
ncbi:MAG: hypothetical protein KIT33_15210 [Candidatus Kapabacteria bacterium]|nr:hypothetical protein [Ignavibacteriota bacterium]MCW5886318.1 hypothetical protein [Candidatus Kapabacteria bacterium]